MSALPAKSPMLGLKNYLQDQGLGPKKIEDQLFGIIIGVELADRFPELVDEIMAEVMLFSEPEDRNIVAAIAQYVRAAINAAG